MEALLKSPLGQSIQHGVKVAVFIGISAAITSILGFISNDPVLQSYISVHLSAFTVVSVINIVLASSLKYLQVK